MKKYVTKEKHILDTSPWGHEKSVLPSNYEDNFVSEYNDYIYYYDYNDTNKRIFRYDRETNERLLLYKAKYEISDLQVYNKEVYFVMNNIVYKLLQYERKIEQFDDSFKKYNVDLYYIQNGKYFISDGKEVYVKNVNTKKKILSIYNFKGFNIDNNAFYSKEGSYLYQYDIDTLGKVKTSKGGGTFLYGNRLASWDKDYYKYKNGRKYYKWYFRIYRYNGKIDESYIDYDYKGGIYHIMCDGKGGIYYRDSLTNSDTYYESKSAVPKICTENFNGYIDIVNDKWVKYIEDDNVLFYDGIKLEYSEKNVFTIPKYSYDFKDNNIYNDNVYKDEGVYVSDTIVQIGGYIYYIKGNILWRELIGDRTYVEKVALFSKSFTPDQLVYYKDYFYVLDNDKIYKLKFDGSVCIKILDEFKYERYNDDPIRCYRVNKFYLYKDRLIFNIQYRQDDGDKRGYIYSMEIPNKEYVYVSTDNKEDWEEKLNLLQIDCAWENEKFYYFIKTKWDIYYIYKDDERRYIIKSTNGYKDYTIYKPTGKNVDDRIRGLRYDDKTNNIVYIRYWDNRDLYEIVQRTTSGSYVNSIELGDISPYINECRSKINELYVNNGYKVIYTDEDRIDNGERNHCYLLDEKYNKIRELDTKFKYLTKGYIYSYDECQSILDPPDIDANISNNKVGNNTDFIISGTVKGENLKVVCKIGNCTKSIHNNGNNEFCFKFNTNELNDGIYENVIVYAVDVNNNTLSKVNLGNIKVDKSLENINNKLDDMLKYGNGETRVLVIESDSKLDYNTYNVNILNNILDKCMQMNLDIIVIDVDIDKNMIYDKIFNKCIHLDENNIDKQYFMKKIIYFINDIRQKDINNAFVTNKDKLEFIKKLFDKDKDYRINENYKISDKQIILNADLNECIKRGKEGTLMYMLKHYPNVYDNAVNINDTYNSEKFENIEVSTENEQLVLDGEGSKIMYELYDNMRGKWRLQLIEYDDTNNELYDKKAYSDIEFYIHKAPIPKFIVFYDVKKEKVILKDNGSYDLDYQYSMPNKGISKYCWRYKIINNAGQEVWIDAGGGKNLKQVEININLKNIIDYELTVFDTQGAHKSISKKHLIYDKPIIDFDYVIKNKTNYFYQGNIGKESITIKECIDYNDDYYNELLYGYTEGREKIYSYNLSQDKYKDKYEICKDINKKVLLDEDINVSLNVINKVGMEKSIKKKIKRKQIQLVNDTYKNMDIYKDEKVFKTGNKYILEFKVNVQQQENLKDFYLCINSEGLLLKDVQVDEYNGSYTLEVNIPSLEEKEIIYEVNVYSKRTNELLHRELYNSKIIKGIGLENFRITKVYDLALKDYYNNNLEKVFYVNDLALDENDFGGIKLTKGYKFDFLIDAIGVKDEKIKIIPRFYIQEDNEFKEVDLYWINSNGDITKVTLDSYYKDKEIILKEIKVNENNKKIYKGEYYIPATSFVVDQNKDIVSKKDINNLNDIIISFDIGIYIGRDKIYSYNSQKWKEEKTVVNDYRVGDVIKYNYTENGLYDHIKTYRVR